MYISDMKYESEKTMKCEDRSFSGLIDYLKKTFLYPEIRALCLFRKAQKKCKSKNPITKYFWSFIWLKARRQGYQISLDAKIGRGLCLLHDGVRIIVSAAEIGENCTIGVNCVIGYGYKEGYLAPKIGDRVYIGHNSSIVGGITVGDDVLIAPGAFVNRDVPSNSIVIGNNEIKPKNRASEPYLKIGP